MNLTELLENLNIPTAPETHEHYREQWLNIDCPDCSADWQHYRLGINIAFGYCSCWNCGPKSLTNMLIQATGLSYHEVKKQVLELNFQLTETDIVRSGKYLPPEFKGELSGAHTRYLEGRGFDPDQLVQLWQIQSLFPGSSWAFRIFIPIYFRGDPVSWSTRQGHDKTHAGRYRSSPPERERVNHKHILYGEDFARHAIIICEGFTDVWKIGPGAVATMGTGFTLQQVNRLKRFPVRAVCFDSEPEAQQRATQLCNMLECFPGSATYNVQLDAKDPGSAPHGEIRKLRKAFLE